MTDIKFKCPECHGENVTTTAEESFMANTDEHYCHSVKSYDADAKANCIDCQWQGRRDQFVTGEIPRRDRKSRDEILKLADQFNAQPMCCNDDGDYNRLNCALRDADIIGMRTEKFLSFVEEIMRKMEADHNSL